MDDVSPLSSGNPKCPLEFVGGPLDGTLVTLEGESPVNILTAAAEVPLMRFTVPWSERQIVCRFDYEHSQLVFLSYIWKP